MKYVQYAAALLCGLGLSLQVQAISLVSPDSDGTAANPFTSLQQAFDQSPGIYHFNLGGQSFSTYVDAQAWVQVAIDFGADSGNLPQSDALSTASRGLLTAASLAVLDEATEVRVSTTDGAIDVSNNEPTLLDRIRSNTALYRGSPDNAINNSWTGINAAAINADASCDSAIDFSGAMALQALVVQVCGDTSGVHWASEKNWQRVVYDNGNIAANEAFQLWVRADRHPVALWLKADAGLSLSGDLVSAWTDQSLRAQSSTVTGVPTRVHGADFNFNPSIDLGSGANGFSGSEGFYRDQTFVVFKPRVAIDELSATSAMWSMESNAQRSLWLGSTTTLIQDEVITLTRNASSRDAVLKSALAVLPARAQLLAVQVDGDNDARFSVDGSADLHSSNVGDNPSAQSDSSWSLGMTESTSYPFDGQVAEFISMNASQSATDTTAIYSYLALKYGIQLDSTHTPDYLDSTGSAYWQAAANVGHDQGVFGVGRDDSFALDQRIARSNTSDSVLSVALEADFDSPNTDPARSVVHTNDRQFLMFAHNGASATDLQSSGVPMANAQRLARQWKVDKSANFNQTVSLQFSGFDSSYLLILDNDGDFSTGFSYKQSLSAEGVATGLSLSDGVYLTLIKPDADKSMWWKADAGMVLSGSDVLEWRDQSLYGEDLSSVKTLHFQLNPTGLNFNPTVDNPDRAARSLVSATDTLSSTVAMVVQPQDPENCDGVFGNRASDFYNIRLCLEMGEGWHVPGNGADYSYPTGQGWKNGLVGNNPRHNNEAHVLIVNSPSIRYMNLGVEIGDPSFIRYMPGKIAEIIGYFGLLSDTERRITESYLATKYGISLDQSTATDYLDSQGAVVWSAADNGGYNQGIFGIARDDSLPLDQRLSTHSNGAALIVSLDSDFSSANAAPSRTVAHNNDRQHLYLGHNGGALSLQNTEIGGDIAERLGREWRVDKSANFNQSVNLKFSGLPAGDFALYQDSDGDFSAGATRVGPLSNGEILAVDLQDGMSYTLVSDTVPSLSGNPGTEVDEDSAYLFSPSATDQDGDSLSFSIVGKPAWASFDSGTGALSGTPVNADVGDHAGIVISVSDGANQVSLPAFAIEVINSNDAPQLVGTVDDRQAGVAQAFALELDTSVFSDEDVGDSLQLSAPTLPAWLNFDPASARLSGTPSDADLGANGLVIRATDGGGAFAELSFQIEVFQVVPLEGALTAAANVHNGGATLSELSEALSAIDGAPEVPQELLGELAAAIGRRDPAPTSEAELIAIADALLQRASNHPVLSLRLEQGGQQVQRIRRDGGTATVTADIANPVPGLTISYDWSDSDARLMALSSVPNPVTEVFSFEPASLDHNDTPWVQLSARRDGLLASGQLRIPLAPPGVSAAEVSDSDGDGIVDSFEGELNAAVDNAAANQLQTLRGDDLAYVIEADAGLRLRLGSVARENQGNQAQITLADLLQYLPGATAASVIEALPSERDLAQSPVFDFEVAELPRAGASATVVLPLQTPLYSDAQYVKYHPRLGWRPFVEDGLNRLRSAPSLVGIAGQCPPPGDGAYQPGLSEGHSCIELLIEDGGANDADRFDADGNVAEDGGINGMIKDPGAVVYASRAGLSAETAALTTGVAGGALGLGMLLLGLWPIYTRGVVGRMPKRRNPRP